MVLWVEWYARYSATLSASKSDTTSLGNRTISDADFLDDWAKTDEAKEYREDQEKMTSEQTVFGEELGEMMEKPQPPAPISTWSFNKIDAIHFAKWGVEVISEWDDVYIILTQDFSTPRWPDLYVLLSKNTDDTYNESDALNKSKRLKIELTPLQTTRSIRPIFLLVPRRPAFAFVEIVRGLLSSHQEAGFPWLPCRKRTR